MLFILGLQIIIDLRTVQDISNLPLTSLGSSQTDYKQSVH